MSTEQTLELTPEEVTLRVAVKTREAFQQVRLATFNRIRVILRRINLGMSLTEPETKDEHDAEQAAAAKEAAYTDAKLIPLIAKLQKQEKITGAMAQTLTALLETAGKAKSLEGSFGRQAGRALEGSPLWEFFLTHVRGIAAPLASQLIVKLSPVKYERPSSLWRHCGMHMVCPKCTEERQDPLHEGMRKYAVVAGIDGKCPECGLTGVSPRRRAGVSTDYKPDNRTLVWVVASCLIKTKSKIYYDRLYLSEKEKQLKRRYESGMLKKLYGAPYTEEDIQLRLSHAHNRAARKMVKIFLVHFWVAGRMLEDMSVVQPYAKERLKHKHIITVAEVLKANDAPVHDKLIA